MRSSPGLDLSYEGGRMRTSRTVDALLTREGGLTIRGVQFRVLGPLEVTDNRGPVALGGPKQRRLLAVLISRLGESVSADVLAEAVWEGRAPRSAAKTLQGYIVHLRQALAVSAGDSEQVASIATTSAGYRLRQRRMRWTRSVSPDWWQGSAGGRAGGMAVGSRVFARGPVAVAWQCVCGVRG